MGNYYFLFLDDIRNPDEAYSYTKNDIFLTQKWVVVRSYKEFTNHIESNGLPFFISFDHDLADSHYTPEHLWCDYDKSKEWQSRQAHKEKTGYECAKWLVEYCMDKDLKCPKYYCHSMNPVGKDNILSLLNNFDKNKRS